MRRPFIFPHRSVRGLRVSGWTIAGMVFVSAALSAAVWMNAGVVLEAHTRLAGALLHAIAGPLVVYAPVNVFDALGGTVSVPLLVQPEPAVHPAVALLLSAAACIAVFRRYPLARSFVVFLGVLLAFGAIPYVFGFSYGLAGAPFVQLWLRAEILIWAVLPLATTVLFALAAPSVLAGAGWVVLTLAFGVQWSAARLTLSLLVSYYTGDVLLPLLWFGLGLLADVMYVLFFYSLAINFGSDTAWEARTEWLQP